MTAESSPSRFPWRQLILPVVLVIILFGGVIPKLVDYEAVWAAIASLEWNEVALLAAMGMVASFGEGSLYTVLVSRLGLFNGWKAFLGGNTIAGFAPNPFDIVVRFAMYRGFGVSASETAASLMIGGSLQSLYSVLAPILALAVFVATGHGSDKVRILTELAVVAAIAAVVLIVVVLRSEAIAAWFGRAVQRAANRLFPIFRKDPPGDLEELVLAFRSLTVGTIARRGWPSLGFLTASHIVKFLGMLLLFRLVGVGAADVNGLELLGAYTIGLMVSLMPLIPAGLGATELAYIWLLARDDQALAELVAAATFSHRIFFWLLPIVVGVVPPAGWIRGGRDGRPADEGADLRALLNEEEELGQEGSQEL